LRKKVGVDKIGVYMGQGGVLCETL
jgi:hypothetical protein